MEISGASSSLNTITSLVSRAPGELQQTKHHKQADDTHHHRHHGKDHPGRALGVFRQELQLTLKAHFQAKFSSTHPAYAPAQEPSTADDIAAEALGAAKQIVAESPTTAAQSLISFKAKVQETASFVRQTFGENHADVEDIDKAVATLDDGVNELESEVASNRESSASVLAVDTRTKQQSTIRIRTQEGDIVKLTLKRVDHLSATDVAVSNNTMSANSTQLEASSRSRMKLQVEGDLSDTERTAIENVFAQAQKMADEFFGGDIATAFKLAEGFEFDAEQLAGVNMRFKMRQVTNVAYAESVSATSLAATSAAAVTEPVKTVAATAGEPKAVIDAPVTGEAPVAEPVQVAVDQPAADDTALSSLFDSLSTFLRSIGEGFESGSARGSIKYHYSESFKLDLLQAVIHTLEPEKSSAALTEFVPESPI